MKDKLNEIFEALKCLDIKPTPKNVSILNGVYITLQELYNEPEEGENNAGTDTGNEGSAADPE